MGDQRSATSEQETEEQAGGLHKLLEAARAGERRAQALLESVASLMGLADQGEVLRGVAENAVRHIGVSRACVYRVDHDAGVLREVACVGRDAPNGELSDSGTAPRCAGESASGPIEMRPGSPLGEFSLSDRAHTLLPPDQADGPAGGTLLVQMRSGRGPDPGQQGVLVGLIAAACAEPPTQRQVELLRALASMGAAAAEAARIEEFRSQLVSAVSHELRTPLAAIRAYNELLLDEDAGEINEEQRLFLERIETTCLQLDRMVEDLLDLSRLKAGEMVIRRAPVDVVSVIEHIIDTLSPEARGRDVSLDDEIIGELPLISSNSDRLAQVLFNLVGNAVKYVHEGGSVLVRVGLTDADLCARRGRSGEAPDPAPGGGDGQCLLMIEVIDDGPGIAADELGRVFDEFYRGRLTERTTKGSGLGLAIALRLTRLLGGTLDVESTPGEGSTFYLIFPVEATDAEQVH
ncbi:MAG: sensor histidine kinase [Armatimonadota bacterium]|jgi:signal transduction histidine kinase